MILHRVMVWHGSNRRGMRVCIPGWHAAVAACHQADEARRAQLKNASSRYELSSGVMISWGAV